MLAQLGRYVAGAPGAAIVQTVRSTGPVTMAAASQSVPLTSNTWTQRAGEINVLYGQVRLVLPPTTAACSADPANRYLFAGLSWNGQTIAQFAVYLYSAVGEYNFKIPGIGLSSQPGEYASFVQPFLPPPSSDTPGTLEMSARDFCNGSAHYQIDAVEFQVVRVAS